MDSFAPTILPPPYMNPITTFQNWAFKQIHGRKLVYNTCWEDPRCDRMLLDIQADSKLVMITSAGDNALDYLLDDPAEIHAVDMNYRQNALLELKKACYSNIDHNRFFDMFGKGAIADSAAVYHDQVKAAMPEYARAYWDKKISYFNGKGIRNSFYYRGTSGILAYLLTRGLRIRKGLYKNAKSLLAAPNITEQIEYYLELERRLFNSVVRVFLNNPYTMALAGVPRDQQALISEYHEGGTLEYVQNCFRKIFTALDVSDNYFYQVYFNGEYTHDCCPEYLKAAHYDLLASKKDRIHTYTTTLSEFLKDKPGTYSHYILLDHQDWLAGNHPEALEEEWQLILQNSRPGTRILLRSAAQEVRFFPDFVKEKVHFDHQAAEEAHQLDRVGTYASVYLGIVK